MCVVLKINQIIYERAPDAAIIKLLIDQDPLVICKKCAIREIGSKRKKELDELEKNS